MKKMIILASASPRRRELLSQIGWEPLVLPSKIEEVVTSKEPEAVVLELSKQKAEDVARSCKTEGWVIGADTVVSVDGEILLKPKSEEEAFQMLNMLQGRSHFVYTGVALMYCLEDGTVLRSFCFSEKTGVDVWPMGREEMAAYIASGEPFDKAGGYGIQGLFAAYVKGICGDYNNVVGLPVGRVYQEIRNMEEEDFLDD